MTPDLERAARAAYEASPVHVYLKGEEITVRWEELSDGAQKSEIRAARAVLLAIREPSEEMRIAGRECDADQIERPDSDARNAIAVWQRTIDSILGEKPT